MKKYTKTKQFSVNFSIIFISSILICMFIFNFAYKALNNHVKISLTEIAKQGAEIIERDIDKKLAILETLAKIDRIQNPDIPTEDKLLMLNTYFNAQEFFRISIADLSGYSKTSDKETVYVGDREYFIKAMAGQRNVSDPLISRIDGNNVVTFAVPVYHQNKIISVLYATYPVEELSLMTDRIKFGKDSYAFILDRSGTAIAHDDRELVYKKDNILQKKEYDPSLLALKKLHGQMTEGKSGAGEYKYEDTRKIMGYAPIRGTEWSLGVCAPYSAVFADIYDFLSFLLFSSIVVIMIIVVLNLYLKITKEKLNKQVNLSRNAIDTAKMIIISFDNEGKIIEFNRYAEEKTGYQSNEIIHKKTIYDLVEEDVREKVEKFVDKIKKQEFEQNISFAVIGKMGQYIHIVWNINSYNQMRIKDNIEIMGIDITDRVLAEKELIEQHDEINALYEELTASDEELRMQCQQLSYHQEEIKKSQERYEMVVQASNIGIWDWNMITNEKFFSDKCYEIFGLNRADKKEVADLWLDRVHSDDVETALCIMNEHLEKRTNYYEGEYRIKTEQENYKWIYSVGKALWDFEGKPYRMAGTYQDITQKKEYEEKIKNYAYFDLLTGLPNRLSFLDKFNSIANENDHVALIFMDLDNFKFINDSYGHSFGDLLLKQVGKRLAEVKGYNYVVSRFGGDEYAILLLDVSSNGKIEQYCKLLIDNINQSYEIDEIQLHVSVSIGISKYPDHGNCFEELLKHADIAMYKAKELGKNTYAFYTQKMNDEVTEKIAIQNHMRGALANNEFVLHYQPQFDIKEKTIIGFEALVRWNSPALGMISPLKFIGIAEENRMIIPLGEWILKRACEFIKQINKEYSCQYVVSVNISMIQLLQEDFVERVMNTLNELDLDPNFLELELTESILMQSFDIVIGKLNKLNNSGIRIALDDFGKGYSSLSYLRDLPISTLKIDKSFIDNIENIEEDTLTESIIYLGKRMGLLILAEGVETQKQLDYLANNECDRIQGYILGKPMPENTVRDLLSREKNQNS